MSGYVFVKFLPFKRKTLRNSLHLLLGFQENVEIAREWGGRSVTKVSITILSSVFNIL
ncbi:hypothetical protein VCRA2133O453_130085 [Vibrio crassostreae]|nr:hypothetical protein VCRA2133O453_130085 [Vibrio crassostreae]CAK2661067.1 hypothetical protein VCRA2133O452_130019 [Vibrio crassostreae]